MPAQTCALYQDYLPCSRVIMFVALPHGYCRTCNLLVLLTAVNSEDSTLSSFPVTQVVSETLSLSQGSLGTMVNCGCGGGTWFPGIAREPSVNFSLNKLSVSFSSQVKHSQKFPNLFSS